MISRVWPESAPDAADDGRGWSRRRRSTLTSSAEGLGCSAVPRQDRSCKVGGSVVEDVSGRSSTCAHDVLPAAGTSSWTIGAHVPMMSRKRLSADRCLRITSR